MKKVVPLKECEAGQKLAQDIYTRQDTLLVARGTEITPRLIERLRRECIQTVIIEAENGSEEPAGESPGEVPGPTESPTQAGRPHSLELVKIKQNLARTKYILEEVTQGRSLPLEVAQVVAQEVCEIINDNSYIYSDLMKLRTKDSYTYEHSLGVCFNTTALARNLVLTREELWEVSLSALLHDIGKAQIPDEILKKPDPLTDEECELIKLHPTIGYQLVMQALKNEDVAAGVLHHHEREDGSGYPLGIGSEEIHRYAKLINISDTFDAIISERAYRPRGTPFKAFGELWRNLEKFDYGTYVSFIRLFSQYYIGSKITLNTGHQGYIVQIDIEEPGRPLVRVGDYVYDLRKLRGLFITELLV